MTRAWLILLALLGALSALVALSPEVAGADVSSGSSQSAMLALERAINTGDVDAAVALFTDDAIVWSQGGMIGKQQIRTWLEQQVAAGLEIHSNTYVENGPRTTWVAEVAEQSWYRAGIGPIRVPGEVVMSRGQIQRLTFTINWTGPYQSPSMGVTSPAVPAQPLGPRWAGFAGLAAAVLGSTVLLLARRRRIHPATPGSLMLGLRELADRRARTRV